MWRRFVMAALPLAFASAPASAEPVAPQFALSVARLPGAEKCASAAATALAVERILGRSVFVAPGSASVVIEGTVAWSAPDAAYRAHIAITDAKGALVGTRDLATQDPTCKDLDAALALAIALFIDPTASLSPSSAVQPPTASTAPPLARAPEPSPPVPHVVPAFELSAGVGAIGATGLLPSAAPGGVAKFAASPNGKWFATLDAALFAEEPAAVLPSGSVGFSLASAVLGLCPVVWRYGDAMARPCLGLLGGIFSVHGVKERELSTRHRPLFAPTARVDVSVSFLRSAFVALSAGLLIPTERDSFEAAFDGQTQAIFRPSSVAGTLDLSIGVRAP